MSPELTPPQYTVQLLGLDWHMTSSKFRCFVLPEKEEVRLSKTLETTCFYTEKGKHSGSATGLGCDNNYTNNNIYFQKLHKSLSPHATLRPGE